MSAQLKKLIIANWKMNGSRKDLDIFVSFLKNYAWQSDVVLCPPSVYLQVSCDRASDIKSSFFLGAQDCSEHDAGAFTGDISAVMLKDVGASYVILGHSERRAYHAESDQVVAAKVARVLSHGLVPVICIGETKEEYSAGQTKAVLKKSLDALCKDHVLSEACVIAYEPIWCIGTGLLPSSDEIQEAHAYIYSLLQGYDKAVASKIRILYGGSLNADNAQSILSLRHVDGGLIGGASLKADSFYKIVAFADQVSMC